MRFGNRRGVTLALAAAIGLLGTAARADWFTHTIPKVAPAVDLNTGGEYMMPPVPWGHYAKDPHGALAKHAGLLHGAMAKHGGLFGKHGCKDCGDGGGLGHGGLGHGGCKDCGDGHGHGGLFAGHGHGGGLFAGHGHGGGLFGKHGHGHGDGGMLAGHGLGSGDVLKGLCGGDGPCASAQAPAPAPSPQGVVVDPCGVAGCGKGKGHGHGMSWPCGGCKGRGCGACGGKGLFHGSVCDSCDGAGCGHCGKGGHGGCGNCGGKGCGLCSHLRNKLNALHPASLKALLGHPKVKYFVGPGGPVPITPGYVPYVVPVRSPRDYFAFPPFTNNVPY